MNIKYILGPTAMALGLALALNTEGRAAETNRLSLPRDMVIAGVDLRAGTYTVEWKVQGTRATVMFSREGRIVATVQGKYTAFDRSATTNTLYFSKNSNGLLAINALGFAGTTKGILFPLLRSGSHQPADSSLDHLLKNRWWGENATSTVAPLHK
jgi:hypothetical protein